jgi:uncharacterized membrane protein
MNMKQLLAGLMAIGLMIAVGCEKKVDTPTKGGTGAEPFTVQTPKTAPELKPGEKQEVKLSLERTKDFKDDVTLKFEAPKGLTVEPDSKVMAAADKDTMVKVAAAADAAEGKQTITITATPKSGKAASAKLEVNVKKGEAK